MHGYAKMFMWRRSCRSEAWFQRKQDSRESGRATKAGCSKTLLIFGKSDAGGAHSVGGGGHEYYEGRSKNPFFFSQFLSARRLLLFFGHCSRLVVSPLPSPSPKARKARVIFFFAVILSFFLCHCSATLLFRPPTDSLTHPPPLV